MLSSRAYYVPNRYVSRTGSSRATSKRGKLPHKIPNDQTKRAMSDLPLHHQHPRVRCLSEESSSKSTFSDNPLSPLATHTYGSTSEILPYLWISTTGDGLLQDAAFLKESGIVFVVNCCERDSRRNNIAIGGDYLSEEGFTTLNLNLKDDSTQSLTEAFQKFFPVVQRAKEANQKCLILCHSGMSRSVSLVIAYLLTCERMSLIEAFAHVKERRKIASPNPGFMAQLIQLERETRSSVTLDLERYKNDRFGDPFSFAVELRNSSGGHAADACTVGGGPTYHIATGTSDEDSPLEGDEGSLEKKKIRKRYGFASSSSSSSSPTISITPIFIQQKRYPPSRQHPGSGSSSQTTLGGGGGGGDRKGEDVFVTFTFSFDEAKPRCRTKGHSDISVQFWEEVKQHNNLNTTPSGPYHCHSSDYSASDPSPLHHSRSESTEFSAVKLTTDLISPTSTSVEHQGNPSDNIYTSTLAPSPIHNSRLESSDFSAVNITPDLCSTTNSMQQDGAIPLPPSTATATAAAAAPDSIVSSPSSVSLHQLMPMLQGVSSYVTSFLKCNNSFPVLEGQEDIIGGHTNRNIVSKRVALLDTDLES